MSSARILLVGGPEPAEAPLLQILKDAAGTAKNSYAHDLDETMIALVGGGFHLCVVYDNPSDPEFALTICRDTKEAGVRVPIIILLSGTKQTTEEALFQAGASAAMKWNGEQRAMLYSLVHLTVEIRKSEHNLRTSNDRLMREMRTLQDERERAEAVNAEYIELMENYAIATEKLKKINQEKNKFFSIIAHDLRSPFTGLIGFSSLLKDGAETLPGEKIKLFANHIFESSNNIFKLLENLLEWSRLQMNRVTVTPCLFPMDDATIKAFELLKSVAQEKSIHLDEIGIPMDVYADHHMVDAVMRNLVSNALKFTPNGGLVSVIYDIDKTLNIASISVRDTGVGMHQKTALKLFKMSETISTNGTNGEHGTGLGLLLCAELIHRNHGTIYVESAPSQGSTFTFTLPLHAPSDADPSTP